MKKIFLSFAVGAMAMTASAYTFSTPQFWAEDFVEMAKDSDYVTDGWLTYGNGATPSELDQLFYPADGSGPYFVLFDYGSYSIAMATTDFANGEEADQWLITPEIEVPYGMSTLSFYACTYNAQGQLGSPSQTAAHPYKVMVSETGGTAKEDFAEAFAATVTCRGSENVEMTQRIISLNGYEGKTVRLAFVVSGSQQGLTGFTDLRWGQYTMLVDSDLTKEVVEIGDKLSIDYNIKLKAPTTCPSLHADLYVNGEKLADEDFKKTFGSATSYTAIIQRLKFSDLFTVENDNAISYRLELTPDFEGAVTSVIEGGVGVPKIKYLNNVVVEEMTGAGCGWCPRGAAALDFYHDTYKGSDEEGKVISIAIHNTAYGSDPMALGNERYTTTLAELNGSAGLPGAVFNRTSRGLDPVNDTEVKRQLAERSHNTATITAVEMPQGNIEDIEGQTATVTFEVKNGYDAQMRNLSAAVVLIENNVTGKNRDYNQTNYLAGYYNTGREAYNAFATLRPSEDMIPYFNLYCASGEFGSDPVPFSKMVYNHASRGIFPAFQGQTLNNVWESDVPQTFSIDFEIPSTVLDIANTEVVLLVINNADQAIVASDIFPAANYTQSGVETIEADDNEIAISAANGTLSITASGAVAEVFALDGTLLARYNVDGNLNVNAAWNGLVVVKVTTATSAKTAKLLF